MRTKSVDWDDAQKKKNFYNRKEHAHMKKELHILYNDVEFFSGLSAELSYDVYEHLLLLHDVH